MQNSELKIHNLNGNRSTDPVVRDDMSRAGREGEVGPELRCEGLDGREGPWRYYDGPRYVQIFEHHCRVEADQAERYWFSFILKIIVEFI